MKRQLDGGWFFGRHSLAVVAIVIVAPLVCAIMLFCCNERVYQIPIYMQTVCFPDASAAPHNIEGVLYQCPSKMRAVNCSVLLFESIIVAANVAIYIALAPLMPTWERLNMWKMRVYSACSGMASMIILNIAIIISCCWILPKSSSLFVVTLTNAWIDSVLFLLGIACCGKLYGLGLGVIVAALNIVTQGLQARAGFVFRAYMKIGSLQAPGQHALIYVMIVFSVVSLGLWAASGARGFVTFE